MVIMLGLKLMFVRFVLFIDSSMLYMHIVQLLKHFKIVHANQNKFNFTTNEAKANSTVVFFLSKHNNDYTQPK